jgi:Flp pilus assembly protein TadG
MQQTKLMQTVKTYSPNHSQRGQALVEFALVLLFIILPFTFVVIDGALTLFTLSNVTNAAREGARAGSIYQTFASGTMATIDAERNDYAREQARNMLGPLVDFPACDAGITGYSPSTPTLGNPYREMDSLTFRVACPRRLFFGLVGTGVVTLTSEATMRIEPGGTCLPDPDDPTKCEDGISP